MAAAELAGDDVEDTTNPYTGLTDEGFEPLIDFRIEERPRWDSGDTVRWKLEGWRLGIDSRRMEYEWRDQVLQSFSADYRQIPNNRIGDAVTPYRGVGGSNLSLASTWATVKERGWEAPLYWQRHDDEWRVFAERLDYVSHEFTPDDSQAVQAQQPGSIVNHARGSSVVIGLPRQHA